MVWNFRDREEWDLTETVGRWRGQYESTNLASVDRTRQRKEREEADAAGTWSDESGGEHEKNPDEASGTLDWEAKTQARKRVREEAEKAGVLCYYPDGSFKEGRSGWGWVVQQAERELRSDYGPVRLYGEDGWQGAQYHSNNAGELTGVISVLKDVEKHAEKGTTVMIAPDNLWAPDVTMGACGGTVHRRLIREARNAMQAVTAKGVNVIWGWSKGHVGLEWNTKADTLADLGREGAEPNAPVPERARRTKRRGLQVVQLVDAEAVRKAAEDRGTAQEAKRWARAMQPLGDGTAAVRAVYVQQTQFSRRNAEGVSLQGCSKGLRQKITGAIYTEVDVRASHPTMLQARLASVGKRIPLLDEWVRDKKAAIAEIGTEIRSKHGVFKSGDEIKELVLAMLNGASAEKWVREKWGVLGAPPRLARFAKDMQTARAHVHLWFPEIWSNTEGAGSDYKRRSRAVHQMMTSLEDAVLEAMREALPKFGVQCDALTGDGLLARPICEAATPLPRVLEALEAEVLSKTGVAVKLAGKTLDGNKASEWPTRVHASSAPDSSAGFRLAEFCSGDG